MSLAYLSKMLDHGFGIAHALCIVGLQRRDEIGERHSGPDHQRALRDHSVQADQVDVDEGAHAVGHVVNAWESPIRHYKVRELVVQRSVAWPPVPVLPATKRYF